MGLGDGSRRIVRITPGNLRNSHIYVREHLDFFPADCVGPSRRRANGDGRCIELELEGLGEVVSTDIGASAANGKPRGFFRGRQWVRRFLQRHHVEPGDLLALEYIESRRYRLSVARRALAGGGSFTAAEFFAGIGLVRLALERHEWEVVFANDIDLDKVEMYRHNWPLDDHLLVEDIHKLPAEAVPTCDLFTASFPCNDLSIAGRREALSGRKSSGFWGLIRIVREMESRQPPLTLLGNVVGFLMSNGGRGFEQALPELNELGNFVDALALRTA